MWLSKMKDTRINTSICCIKNFLSWFPALKS